MVATRHQPDTRYCVDGDHIHIDIHLDEGHTIGRWKCDWYVGGLATLSWSREGSRLALVFVATPGEHTVMVEVVTRDGHLMRREFRVLCD